MKTTKKIKTVFFGSGIFAEKILRGILDLDFLDIIAVVTQPDKKAGRKMVLTSCPVMETIKKENIKVKVYQPEKLRNEDNIILEKTQPEFILVADYGQIIPKSIIDYPKYKCVNIHGSILPDLRGAVPVQMAILNGYSKTGVSIVIMTPGLDDGDVLVTKETKIKENENALQLRLRLADLSLEVLAQILPLYFEGKIKGVPQNHEKATITKQSDISKEKAQITSKTNAITAMRMIRAFNPWPIAWAYVDFHGSKKRVKIYDAILSNEKTLQKNIFMKLNKKLYLFLNEGALEIKKIQLEGKNIVDYKNAFFLDKINLVD